MGTDGVKAFLFWLAVARGVAANTQTLALIKDLRRMEYPQTSIALALFTRKKKAPEGAVFLRVFTQVACAGKATHRELMGHWQTA